MEKRALIAVVLSLAIWLVWSYFFMPKQPVVKESRVEKTVETKKPEDPVRQQKHVDLQVRGAAREQEIPVETGIYSLTLSTKGAAIIRFKYIPRNVELIVGKNIYNAKGNFNFSLDLSEEGFLDGSNLDTVNWNVVSASQKEVRFQTTVNIKGNPVRIEKKYSFQKDASYFKVSYSLTNLGNGEVQFPNGYVLVSPSDFLGPEMDFNNSYNQIYGMYYVDNDFDKDTKGGGLFSKNGPVKRHNGRTQWVGIMSRYFLLILIPEEFTGTGVITDNRKETGFRTGMYIPADVLKPGREFSKSFKVYAGEKDKAKLKELGETLIEAADISKWIEPIRDFLLWALLKINIVFGNFGWSLVVFSLITKVVLLPLTLKSTESMKKLQELNPQMTEIREKYKDKPDMMNKKVMELYKKNKVNPASGCLPILVQMPFFFALYSALINSIDLWQAPFILWINDLSLPDTILQIKGFDINILPIIMTGTTYLQQRMSSGDVVGQQQKMMMMMPLIFIVIFWNMPSGLVLYWTMQNLLQILHQLYVTKWGKKAKNNK